MVPEQSQLILNKAREWLNTPWQHHQQSKGLGVDCISFIEAVYGDCGQIPPYDRYPDSDIMLCHLRSLSNLNEIPLADRLPGDLLLFRIGKMPSHVGICNGNGMIHADSKHGVTEIDNLGRWERRLVAVFRFDGTKNR